MKDRVRVIVYPFDVEFMPIVRHSVFLNEYEIVGLVSPKGWGLCGQDAGIADYGEPVGIKVSSAFEELLNSCDTVIFTESNIPLDFEKSIQPKVSKAIEMGKNIICTLKLEEEWQAKISSACRQKRVDFKYFNIGNDTSADSCEIEYIHKINTPVIFVLGMSERTQKFEIQLLLREKFANIGYSISQVGSRSYCEMLGFHSIPGFMFGNRIADYKKIVLFNHFLKDIEIKENPDIIIIGIPGGIMPFNNEFTNKFGIMAFQISRAVSPDAAILSTLYDDYKPEYFKELHTAIKYKLGTEIDCYNLSNVKVDLERSELNGSMTYFTFDARVIEGKKENFKRVDTPVYNVFNNDDSDNLANLLINKLADYGSVEII